MSNGDGAGADPLDDLRGDRSPVSGSSQVPQAVAAAGQRPGTDWLAGERPDHLGGLVIGDAQAVLQVSGQGQQARAELDSGMVGADSSMRPSIASAWGLNRRARLTGERRPRDRESPGSDPWNNQPIDVLLHLY